jgi:hypothetical protein
VEFRAPYGVGPHVIRASNSSNQVATTIFTVVAPTLRLSRHCGPAGTQITASGHHFGIGLDAAIYFDEGYVSAHQYPDESGDFAITFALPGGSEGLHAISARNSSGASVSATFELTTNCPSVATVTDQTGTLQTRQPDNSWRPVQAGDSFPADATLRTLADGNATVTLADGTQIHLASNSKLTLDQATYEPATHAGGLLNSLGAGAIQYLSGLIATDETGENKILDTGYGSLGIRGTEFITRSLPCSSNQEVYLVHGQLSVTPYGSGLRSIYDAPIAIFFDATNVTTAALSQAAYDSIKAESFSTNAVATFPAWQIQFFGCTNNPAALPDFDADGDGQNNFSEFMAGTDPTSSFSAFRLISAVSSARDILVTWKCGAGRTNILQATTNLSATWSNVSPPLFVSGAGDVVTNFLDVCALNQSSSKYYRVQLVGQ